MGKIQKHSYKGARYIIITSHSFLTHSDRHWGRVTSLDKYITNYNHLPVGFPFLVVLK